MFNEENKMGGSAQCGEKCRCQGGQMGGKMGMWRHMPKEVKLAMLEMKEKKLQAKLEFIGKMKEMAKKMPDEKM